MPRFLAGLSLLLAGCVSYPPAIRASFDATHEALTLVEKREYAAATRIAEDTLRKLEDLSAFDAQMQYEAYVERGISWFVIGYAKYDASVPRDEKGNRKYDDVFRVMATPEGGAVEFEKAITEFQQGWTLKTPRFSYHEDAFFFALCRTCLGQFEAACDVYAIGLEYAERRNRPDATKAMYLRHRALCNHMYAYHIHARGSGDRKAIREAYERTRDDLTRIQTLNVPDSERTWAKALQDDVESLIKP